MRYLIYILTLISFLACHKQTSNYTTSYEVVIKGDIISHFSNQGEVRKVTVSVFEKMMENNSIISLDQLPTQIISLTLTGEINFSLVDIKYHDHIIEFSILSEENFNNFILEGTLNVAVNGIVIYSCKLYQQQAEIKSDILISSEKNPFLLPDEGGKFSIPFYCKERIMINNKLQKESFRPLSGLKYEIFYIHSAWIHFVEIKKDSDEVGRYIFEITADGPYNMNYESEWFINIYNEEDEIIFRQDFFHCQTPGDEYQILPKTVFHKGTFNI